MQIKQIAKWRFLWAIIAVLGVAPVSLAAAVEAKKDGVEVYADATNKSAVIAKLKQGESVPAGERKGMFWQVTVAGGKSGFVSVLAVKHTPDTNSDLAKAVKSVVNEGRKLDSNSEARARSAVMGVRGLREDDNMANASDIRPNLRAVYQLEDRQFNPKKVQQLGDKVMQEIEAKAGLN